MVTQRGPKHFGMLTPMTRKKTSWNQTPNYHRVTNFNCDKFTDKFFLLRQRSSTEVRRVPA